MKTMHVTMNTFAVAAALMTSTAWAQEAPPIPMWVEAGTTVRENDRALHSNYATQEESAVTTTGRVFPMPRLTNRRIGEQRRVDSRPLGNFSASITFDEVRGP